MIQSYADNWKTYPGGLIDNTLLSSWEKPHLPPPAPPKQIHISLSNWKRQSMIKDDPPSIIRIAPSSESSILIAISIPKSLPSMARLKSWCSPCLTAAAVTGVNTRFHPYNWCLDMDMILTTPSGWISAPPMMITRREWKELQKSPAHCPLHSKCLVPGWDLRLLSADKENDLRDLLPLRDEKLRLPLVPPSATFLRRILKQSVLHLIAVN